MKKSLFLLAVLVCFIADAAVNMSAPVISVRHYNEHNGLPNRQVYDIRTDSAGFVWLFTNSGLTRFDGNEFRNYNLDSLNLSPRFAPYFTKLKTDSSGEIILSVCSGQIFAYDRKTDRFGKTFDFADYGKDVKLCNFVVDGDSTLLATSDGIYLFDGRALSQVSLAGKTVNDLYNVGNGLWIAAGESGLYSVIPSATGLWKAIQVNGSENVEFNSLAYCGGKMFAGTVSDGLWVCPLDGAKAYKCSLPVPAMPFTMLMNLGADTVLASVDGAGLYVIDVESERIKKHILYSPDGSMLSANTVSGISEGKDGIWLSTSSHGINYLTAASPAVSVTGYDKSNPNSLSADCVNIVFQDSDGDMWYGTDAGISLRRKDGTWTHYLSRSRGIDNNILTIAQSDDGIIYTGGYGSGAWSIDKKTGKATRLPGRNGNRGIGTDYVYSIFCNGKDIWFGGIKGDLTRYDSQSNTYYYYPSECVCTMTATDDGTVYITGCGGVGTCRPDGTMDWSRVTGGMEVLSTRDVAYDRERGELWFAAENQGLVRHSLKTGKAEVFDTRYVGGLNNIQGLAIDHIGRLWFYSERDLFVLDRDRNEVVCATPLLGVEDVSFTPRSIIIDDDGNIVIGTTEGAMTLNTNLTVAKDAVPEIILPVLMVNGNVRAAGTDDMPVALDNLDRLVLNNDENTFTIHFSSVSYGNNGLLTYRWRLEGYDDEWQTAGPSHDLVFRNLPFGKYRLEINACSAFTGEVLASRSLDIRILPPLWLSWWAILIYIVVAAVLTVTIIRYIRRRRTERNIADKIHSVLNIVHDLRTPVTLIKAPLGEIESRQDLPEDTLKNARLAMSNVERLLSMIGRLLDLRHESQHSDCLNLSSTSVAEFLQSKVREWKVAAINKGLSIEVDVPEDMPEVMMDRNKVNHILDNLLSNAIKYTFTGGVHVVASFDRKRWYIEISDSGIGIPRNDIQRLFNREYRGANAISTDEIGSGMGLLIVHRLCRLHKGRVNVYSKENKGTKFVLSFPLKYKAPYRIIEEKPVEQPAREEESNVGAGDEKQTLIIIDDEKEMLDYLADALSSTYRTVSFTDGEEALRQIDDINPDIVISDVRLKGMSGFELCQKIKTSVETSHIPVVLLSGLSERDNIILGLESGANDYIVKPFDISVLRLRLRNILEMRQRLQSKMVEGTTECEEEEDVTVSALDREFIDRVRGLIDEHISDSEYSIGELCRDIGMSRTTVYNKIKALTGESIVEYIRTVRLTRGKELLATGEYPVSTVAYMVGFSDPKYFSSSFKRKFGVSPSRM